MQTVTKSMATFNKHKEQIEALSQENEKLKKLIDKSEHLQLKETMIKYEVLKNKYNKLKTGRQVSELEANNISICSVNTLSNDLNC
jgi:hypothetical protein